METDNTAALRADPDAQPPDRRAHSGRPLGHAGGSGRRRRLSRFARLRLRARSRARRRRRLDGPLNAWHTRLPPHRRSTAGSRVARLPLVGFFARLVGPAALTAAGMIGAGAVATRLLAGAWFGFDLLWVALYVVPMVIFTLDSASRVGDALRRPRHVRDDPHRHRRLARVGHLPADGAREHRRQHEPDVGDGRRRLRRVRPAAAGRRAEGGAGLVVVTLVLTAATRGRRGARRLQARREDHDGAAARHPRLLHRRRDQGAARLADVARARREGLVPQHSARRAGRRQPGASRERLHADHGHRRPGAAAGGAAVLRLPRDATPARRRPTSGAAFWKTVQNLGVIWGLFSVVVIVAGATALHAVYTGSGPVVPRRQPLLADREHPGRRPGARPGVSRRARLPGAAVLLARPDRGRVHDADLRVADDDLLLPRHGAARLALHARQPAVQDGVRRLDRGAGARRAVLAAAGAAEGHPRDGRQPGAGAGCGGRHRSTSSTGRRLGEFKASAGRNLVLAITALFALGLVVNGAEGMLQ